MEASQLLPKNTLKKILEDEQEDNFECEFIETVIKDMQQTQIGK